MDQKEPTYDELKELVLILVRKVEILTLRVSELETELAIYKNPKNSGNSSIPPSQDQNRPRKNQSLREKSGKKSGGQSGHKGNSLSMVEVPNQIIVHKIDTCTCCGADISSIIPILAEKRQVVEIPPLEPIYIQHEVYSRVCGCGKVCRGIFPAEVTAPVQYGQSVQNFVSYLSVRHYIPFKRITEIMGQAFGIPLSEGTVANLLQKAADKLYPTYMQIKSMVEKSPVIGADESGIIIDGKLAWVWTWQDLGNTYIAASDNRGFDTVGTLFPNGFPDSILVSDAWPAHLNTNAKGHQLCLAHMLRELNYFIELYPFNQWLENLRNLFLQAIGLKKEMTEKDYANSPARDKILKSFDKLLKHSPPKKSKFYAFYKRIRKHKESVFSFLFNQYVPPDNNGSERSIRNIKIKQKVSGQFKTFDGAHAFTVIRSVIDTLIKRGFNVLNSLENIPKLVPE